ncbi:MAG TPA: PRC and DUF2382 domain-containing protein, partial [Solirubrobacteraceae bacterium]|nr:PRC and DUF2382 domain-containing protein [Solirubrobacteraceae bacterium]
MPQTTEAYDLQDRTLIDADGEKIGKIDELYHDRAGGQPEWALVHTGLFGTKKTFVPIHGAAPEGEDLRVPVSKQAVKDAPRIDPDQELSEQEERQLFEHYGVPYTTAGTTTAYGAPGTAGDGAATGTPASGQVGHDVSGPTTDDAMTRSEEELRVGTAEHERGRARLRKYVVTENVTKTVPVQREEVRVEREPVTDANADRALDGPAISEDEHEVVLHEEEPVVEKRAVPKERVRLGTETVSEEREVSEEVRK